MSTSGSRIGKELYEFGPFRLDPEKQMLLRDGQPIPLTPKAFQVLVVLVQRSNQTVSKDELMSAVWPGTFVEETNLTRNIFSLRKALGETERDRYIITVAGQGYRFAENAHLVREEEADIVAASYSRIQMRVAESKPWRWIAVVLVVVVLVLAAAGAPWFLRRRTPVLTEKDTIVLADFSNSTGDSVFNGTLRQGLAVQLEQSPLLNLISDQRIQHTLRLMGQPPDARLTPELAREVCIRTGSAAVLEGSIAPLGSQYVLGLSSTNCRTGRVLDEEQVQTARKEDVLSALTQIARKFRTRVGESLASVNEYDTPLAEATTASIEALQAYSTGWKLMSSSGAAAALPFFKRAVQIDPKFTVAYAALGRMYADLDQSDLAAEYMRKAWQSRTHASDRERFFIAGNYEMLATGNMEKARQDAEAWVETYPRDPMPHLMLSGEINKAPGRYHDGAVEAKKAIELDPDFGISYYNIAVNDAYLNRFDEAENAIQAGVARRLEIDEFLMLQYDIAFLRGDRSAMERIAAEALSRPGGGTWISNRKALVLAYSGHLKRARSMTHRAVGYAEQVEQKERAGLWEAGEAVREALFGNAPQAKEASVAALKFSKDREVEYGAAFALAVSRESTQARALADDLEKRFPEDTSVRFSFLPVLRAQFALNQHHASKAIEFLQVAVPNELGLPRSSVSGQFGALYPIYVRGESYLALHEGAEATVEFQKILDHRGIVVSDPIGALAHLQLGRAYALEAKSSPGAGADAARAKARAAYQDFLTLWTNADPDIPIMKQAKAEYAKLH